MVSRSREKSKRLNVLVARDNNHNLLLSKIYDCTVNKEYLKTTSAQIFQQDQSS
ncbi:MAG: hypothetical protein HOH73_04730 [Alphaproteobacteria bacterium]|jgi:hypothetical protein|nr:hypothetical protein [Alphaproteobacteria bacterium]